MKYKDFLIVEAVSDGQYKTTITIDEAKDLLKSKCSNANFNKPLFRGMRGKTQSYILQGDRSSRKSLSKEGVFYTLVFNEVIKKENANYPLRTNSIICSTNYEYAKRFGSEVYMIFPYNDTIIAKVDRQDIFDVSTHLGKGRDRTMIQLSNFFKIPTHIDDFDEMVAYIKKEFDADLEINAAISEVLKKMGMNPKPSEYEYFFDSTDNIEEVIMKAFELDKIGLKFIKNNNIDNSKSNEAWLSKECIAIHEDIYNKLIDEGFEI